MKSIFSAILFLLASSFAVTAQANVDFGFEGFTANLNDDGDPDGSYANPDGLYPAYGGAGTGLVSVVQEDGVNSSAMLRFENGPGADWWSGFTLAAEYSGTDFIGDGSVPVTMTVLADQDGTVRLDLEAAGQTPFTQSLAVTSGWNSLSFDLNGVDASINWQTVQIRPDAEGETNNGELARIYYFDDVAFPSATIVQAPAPSNPVTAGFLAGAVTPTVAASDVFSLYSDAYDTADSNSILNGYGITDWSVPGNSQTEMTIDNANEIKRFGDAEFVGYDFPSFAIAGYENLSLSLYRQDTSDFLIKLVDTQVTDENGDPAPNATAQYTIPADQMVAGQWTTINIPMSNFTPSVTKINQIVIEPLLGGVAGATETFYLDDMYFHGAAMVTASVSLEAQSDDAYVYVNSDIWGWSDSVWTEGAAELADGVWTWTYEILAGSSFEYKWVVYAADNTGGPEDLTLLEDGTCAPDNITSDYNARVYVEGADTNIFGECITVDTDGDGIPNANDADDDNDGVDDEQDSFPLDANFSSNEFTDAYFEEAFSGATITLADDGSNVYTFPSTDADAWAGFANQHIAVYPIRLTGAGSITFDASVPTGEDVNVRFRFEKLPFPATEPSFNTDHVTVSGDVESSYTINLPAQGANTFESLIMYIGADCGAANAAADCADEFAADRDVGVVIKNVTVNSDIDDPSTPDINEGSGGNGVAIPGTITFSVDMTGQDTTSATPRVIGDWNSYCGGACGEMTESDVAGVWTLDIPLQPSNSGSTYVFALGDTQETLLYDDGSEIACSNQSPYGEVAEDGSQAYNLNRILEVVNGDAVLPTIPFNDCDSDADGVADSADAFPNDASETADTDGDGVGDNSDYAPNDPNVTVDSGVSVPATPTGGVVMTFEDTSVALNPGYGGVAASYASILEVDGVTTRNMLKLVNNANSAWWSGVALALEFADSDFRGDGSAQVTMRVYAEQDGDLMLQIESGASQFDDKKSVVTGWNNVTFDLSGADTALNWNNVQIRPDALSGVNNVAETVYYIDDVHFADATIVQEPEPTVIIALPVDFEEASDAYEIGGFDGGVASVEAGPDGAVSLKYIKGAGQNWAGVFINLNTAVDAANGEVMTADVYSTEARDITLKFDAANVERVASHTGSGWEALSYDFTGAMPAGQTKIAFFNDLTQQGDGTDAWTIYIDNLAQASAPAPVDSDGDGVADDADAFPNDATETADTDSDGTGDNADAFPNDASETVDTDGDGVGDNSDYAPNDPSVTVAPTVPATPTGGLVLDFENMVDAGAYPVYGGVGASIGQKAEVDGVTVRNMLVLDNGAGADWWSGVTIVSEYVDSDLIGDGSAPVTMRVYADQDGNLNFELEADDQTPVIINKAVVAGWNSLSFDVSAHAAINWHKAQIRPDALGQAANAAATRYYIDDVHFANATIVQEPVPAVIIALPVDFEEAADAYEIAGFDGGVATVEAGPDGANSLKYVKGAGANWAGVWINLNTAVDAANGEVMTADVYSTEARDITLKFDAANVERVASHTGSGWEALSYDFTGAMPAGQTKIAFFNDLTQQGDGTDAWTIYIDNLAQASAPAPVDSDGDGVADDADAFPNDATETVDSDGDGVGDNADAFPNDASETTDTDGDGTGDNADYAPNDPSVTVAPTVPATPTGGLVLDFENMVDAGAYPVYGGVGASIGQKTEVDGVTVRNMLVLDNGAGADWWSGVTIVSEYVDSDLIGDGSAPVTMRVYADQDGNLNFELEADDQTPVIINKAVVAGWNSLSFDVSAHAAINWHKAQIRPDALGQAANAAATRYYIDDVHFANATIVQEPVPAVIIALPVDFEEAADAYEIAGFDGGVATVEAGPDGANSLKYVKGAGANWAGVWINLNTAVDAANGEVMTADVYSTEARDITLKFDAANVERVASHTGSGWEALSYDFTGAMPAGQTKIAFFNDLTQQGDGTDAWTIYIDNLAQASAPAPVDSDGDGVADDADAFPNDATETVDSDGDGVGANADYDDNDASVQNAPVVTTTDYCSTEVTHFNIDNHPGSILVTIENSGADSVDVTATSVADVIDLLIIENVDGGGTASATDITGGVATATISWAAGTMPATVSFGMLWSDEAAAGNQMLNKGDGTEGLGNIDTTFDCATDHPVPAPVVVDTDGDGVADADDAFPNDASETVDTDGDGVGDNSDYAPNDPSVTVAPTVPATPTGGLVLDFENMVDAGAYPVYGGVGASIGQKTEVDGVTVRNMLVLDNGAGADWWSGVTIVSEYVDSDLIGDGSAPVTMRVYADQDGNLNFELEADDQTPVIINKAVVAGWNSLSFDVSAHAAINWHKAQIRPDALGQAANAAATRYYIDDVHFANATIVQEPVPAVIIALPVDFEEAADAYEIAGFDGGVATVEAGPDGANSLKYVKGAGANWAGVWINLNTAVDAANGEVMTADVYSTEARDITLKFDAANVERVASHTGSGWEALSYDFTGAMPAGQTKIAFFNDLTQQGDGTDAWTIYIDNLAQASAPAPVDSDGDGVADDADAFPNDATETVDSDGDGVGANADYDDNDASVQNAPVVTTTDYCSTEVTHFNIDNHPGSILVTIENSGADSVDVTATSVADVIDLLIIENVDGGGTASATDITGGVATATISWAAGTMPATVSFGMLWSDEAAAGNQMLNKGDGTDGLGNIDTTFDCATDHPVPAPVVVDTDGDGVADADDAFPNDASETVDTDGDGVGDNSDYAPNDPSVTVAPTVPATPTGGLVLDFENMVDAGAYPVYGGVGASIGQKTEVDGVTVRNMLVLDNGAGADWWSGVTIVSEYVDSDLIGDGSAPVTMRVYADQDGNLNFELEADDQTPVIINKAVVAGWNSLSFDVSAHAAINWHKAQIRPDALGQAANAAATRYYIDDVHFANATIVQEPVPAVIIALPVDFEEAADAYEIAGFDGGVATVEAGPDGANSLKYVKGAGANWAGVWINLNTAVDAANGEVMTADVYSTEARDITLKFDAANVERVASHTGSGWEALSYDFTGAMPAGQTKIAFFNDLTQQGDGTDAWTIYIDNLAQASAPAPVDSDGDGVADDADAFPNDATETVDSDGDGVGDNADVFPNDGSESADTDSDGTGDNADAFPSDALETTDTDGDGTGDNADYAPNDPNVQNAPALPEQQVSVVSSPMGVVGSDIEVTVGYDASNDVATATGIGMRMHYDSSILTFVSLSDVLGLDNITTAGPINDAEDFDSDPSTDKYVIGAWAAFGGAWAVTLPTELLTVTFRVNDVDSASTEINFSSSSTSVGYQFAPTSYSLDIIEGSFDFDGNGTHDALSDGLLFLRYAFDFTGSAVTDGVVANDSSMSDDEILAALETAKGSFGDIDGNGVVDALTDGILLIRSLFGFSGDALISGAVGDSTTTGAVGDATRTTAAEIQTYIDSMSL